VRNIWTIIYQQNEAQDILVICGIFLLEDCAMCVCLIIQHQQTCKMSILKPEFSSKMPHPQSPYRTPTKLLSQQDLSLCKFSWNPKLF
jgi:hypothetical protein